MENLAALAFYNLPNPTFVLCDNLRIHGVNAAAENFFGEGQKWESESKPCSHFDHTPLENMSTGIPIEELNLKLETDGHGWQDILSRARLNKSGYNNSAHGGLADLQPSEEFAFRLSRPTGDLFANFSISAWEAYGQTFYMMTFHRRKRHQHPPADLLTPMPTPSPDQADGSVSHELMLDHVRARELVLLKSALFESGAEINSLLSIDGRTCYLNGQGSNIIGGIRVCDFDWLQCQFNLWDDNFEDLLDNREWPEMAAHLRRCDIPERHYGFITDTGQRIVLSLQARCLFDPVTGAFIGTVCFGRVLGDFDTVRAKKQDDMLKSCETITESVPHFVWTAYRDGSRDWFSKQWCNYTGLSLPQCLGWGWLATIHPDDQDRLHQRRESALQNKSGYSIEVRCRRWDGEFRWMLSRG